MKFQEIYNLKQSNHNVNNKTKTNRATYVENSHRQIVI